MDHAQVKALRETLNLTQERFAALFGFSFATINRWEQARNKPTELVSALLSLLQDVLQKHPQQEVLRQIRVIGPVQKEILRYLFQLDAQLPQPTAERTTA